MKFLICFLSSIPLSAITPITLASELSYTHNNMNENDFFGNEIEEVIFKYIDPTIKGKNASHTHSIKIDTDTMAFLYPLTSRLFTTSEVFHTKGYLANNLDVAQTLPTEEKEETVSVTNELSTTTALSASATVNFNFLKETISFSVSKTQKHSKTTEEKKTFKSIPVNVPPKSTVTVDYSITSEIYEKTYNLMLPILNTATFKSYSWKKNQNPFTRMFSPSEIFRAIQNDESLLDYYFGKNEFYQYRDFIGQESDSHYFWAAIPVKTYEEIDNQYIKIDNAF